MKTEEAEKYLKKKKATVYFKENHVKIQVRKMTNQYETKADTLTAATSKIQNLIESENPV